MPIHPQVAEFLLTRAGDNPDAPLLPELAGQRGSGSSGLSLRRRTMVAFHKEFHGSPTITAEITFRNKIF
jgi:hypothetical protein